jgi:hypothetical protein
VLRVLDDRRLPTALLAAASAVSAVLLIALCSRLTFLIDDWDFLLHRRGISVDTFMVPHGEHPSMSLIAVYKAIQATIGMESITPYAVVATLTFIASVVVFFVWASRRVGERLALLAALPLLFLGTAWEDLLTPFQLGYFAPMACGLGALLLLDRRDRRGNAWCCALLVIALTFQSLGLVFVVGATVAMALDRSIRWRAWVVAVPFILYCLWWIGWHSDANQFTFDNLATSPAYVLDGFSASTAALFGFGGGLDWGRPLFAGLVLLAGLRLFQLPAVPRGFWVALALGLTFWLLIALNASFGRAPDASRYAYPGAIFVLMCVAELVAGYRPSRAVFAAGLAVVVVAIAGNLWALHDGFRKSRDATEIVRGDLAGLEIAADTVDPKLVLDGANSGFNYFTLVDAGSYLSAADKFGSPAYSPDELLEAPEASKVAADKVVAAALGLHLEPVSDPNPVPGSACERISGTGDGPGSATVPSGGALLMSLKPPGAEVLVRRFSQDSWPVDLGLVPPHGAATLEIPPDRSDRPWQVSVEAGGSTLAVCPLSG